MNTMKLQAQDLPAPTTNRWWMALMGTALQMCIGTVYAWSYFQNPLAQTYGWNNTQVAWVFSTTILFLSLGAAVGGTKLPIYGPRKLAVLGIGLFGSGYLLGALALSIKSLPLLYLGYGVVGGTGIGLAYVPPVATVAKWFPDKKGLATGMVIMGFGLGAMIMSKLVAPLLLQVFDHDLPTVFAVLGVLFLLLATPIAWVLQDPPSGGGQSAGYGTGAGAGAVQYPNTRAMLTSGRFAKMWLVMFCNTVAGIMFISFQSPMVQELWHRQDASLTPDQLATFGATLIALSALFNGVGRFAWGSLSDKLGRITAFRIMLLSQLGAFLTLGFVQSPWVFGALVCYILLCYGGGFGTIASFVSDTFGPKMMATAYGAILTTWGAAGIVGPQLVAWLRDHSPQNATHYAFNVGAAFLLMGFLVSVGWRNSAKEA
jgi:OFA family oxalate/formate antiporter-like MFS transporter